MHSNDSRARAAIFFLSAAIAMLLVYIVFNYMQYNLIKSYHNGSPILIAASTNARVQQGALDMLLIMILTGSAITFLMWSRRAYQNLHLVSDDCRFPEGSAVYSWFIPLANLLFPFLVMRDLYRKTYAALNMPAQKNAAIPVGWWLLVLFSIAYPFIITQALSGREITLKGSFILGSSVILPVIAAAIFAILLIIVYSRAEPGLHEKYGSRQWSDQHP